jgi:hypothetical protein
MGEVMLYKKNETTQKFWTHSDPAAALDQIVVLFQMPQARAAAAQGPFQ